MNVKTVGGPIHKKLTYVEAWLELELSRKRDLEKRLSETEGLIADLAHQRVEYCALLEARPVVGVEAPTG